MAVPVEKSSERWLTAALANLPALLVDHAHCEKKAAAMALRHATRHPEWPGLARDMSRLAREELVHFERVLEELRRREIPFRGQPGSGYGAALMTAVRPPTPAPPGPGTWLGDRTVDEMLICALIEARSHDRFVVLGQAIPDVELRGLYNMLAEAEERHGDRYVELAAEAAGGDPSARLAELLAFEARVVTRPHLPVRMHSGG